jgi:hypothetical protein
MFGVISFTHILNPFPSKPGSEHSVASKVTWASIRAAKAVADGEGIQVECHAVVLSGDESSAEVPTSRISLLTRTVQDIKKLRPGRPLPLIEDILKLGAEGSDCSHIIFSNMDIALQPQFYVSVHKLVATALTPDCSFAISRINIDKRLADAGIDEMYAADGEIGQGYDCFVIPKQLIGRLDLGHSCIGAPHFDLLLYMCLDTLGGGNMRHITDAKLTFHLGNDISWSAMMDYVEFNLTESLKVISRTRATHHIETGSVFDRWSKTHFRANAHWTSWLLRRCKRIPGVSSGLLSLKRFVGRQY